MRIIINFSPRKTRAKQDGQLPIYVRFTVNSKRVDLSTGIFICSNHWDEAKQRINDKIPGSYAINQRLDKLKSEIQDTSSTSLNPTVMILLLLQLKTYY